MSLPPTLGWAVAEWCERNLVWEGRPYRMPADHLALTLKLYEISGPRAQRPGRRIWRRGHIEWPKNLGKSVWAGAIAAVELCGPCRFGGWTDDGHPIAIPVLTPRVICAATSSEQADYTYAKARRLLADGPLGVEHGGFVDDGAEVTRLLGRPGEMLRLTAKMRTKVGGGATFAVRDETGLYIGPELRAYGREIARMVEKEAATAESWMVDTTNAGIPGQKSVAEASRKGGPGAYVHIRAATDGLPLDTREQRRLALTDVFDDWPHVDIDRLLDLFEDAETDVDEWIRWYLGWWKADELRFMQPSEWSLAARPDTRLTAGDDIVCFFDGSDATIGGDWTVLVAVRIADGLAWPLGVWHDLVSPDASIADRQQWRAGVTLRVRGTFASYRVHRLYCDPAGWWEEIGGWATEFGDKRVREFPTGTTPGTRRKFAQSVEATVVATRTGALIHPDHPKLTDHVDNARRWAGPGGDVIGKEHKDSAKKVDLAVALVGGWQARLDELANPTDIDQPDYVQAFY